jgi:hypothetical protein
LDETAFWRSEESANPDIEVYNAILPSMITIPGSMLICISSAYRKAGLLYEKYRDHFGKDDPDILVVKGTTRDFNPNIPQSFIDGELDRDYEAAAAEYLSEWRSDLADYLPREVVEGVVIPGRRELPYDRHQRFAAFVDPSGGSLDSMTLAIAHKYGPGTGQPDTNGKLDPTVVDTAVLDLVREIRPPFNPESVVAEFCEVLKQYKITRINGDRYAGEWPREQFRKRGVTYEPSEKSKTDIYRDCLPLFNAGKVELLDHQRLINQLCTLERRTTRGSGRDIIDHPAGMHDDVANAACGALLFAQTKRSNYVDPEVVRRSFFFRRDPRTLLDPSMRW